MMFLILNSAALSVLLYLFYRKTYSFWSKQGVPGPTPLPFIGNALPLIRKNARKTGYKWFQKYGAFHGEYFGLKPVFVISDAKLAHQVMIKDFHIFNVTSKQSIEIKVFKKMLTAIHGTDWKRIRTAASLTFSSTKLKKNLEHLEPPIQNVFENFDQMTADGTLQKTQFKKLATGFAMDYICFFVFSTKVNSFNQKDVFVQNCFNLIQFRVFPAVLATFAPDFIAKFMTRYILNMQALDYITKLCQEIVRQRRENPDIKYKDFIELMIENGNNLNDEEIISQAILFLFAGLETVSTGMTILMADLVTHPEYQEQILEEIDSVIGDDQIDYDKIMKLQLLDAFLCESFRKTPVADRVIRHPTEDYPLADTGVVLKKDQQVMISVYNIHHDPNIYPDPFEFKPERYLGGDKQHLKKNYWMPFSLGPRNCVAMRFAIIEIKYYFINVIRKYQIRLADGVKTPLESKNILTVPSDFRIKLIPRE